jgi:sulfoquinovose isomerase
MTTYGRPTTGQQDHSPVAWPDSPAHRGWLEEHGRSLLAFGADMASPTGGAGWLDDAGVVDPDRPVFTWITCRMAHVHALGSLLGVPGSRPRAQAALDGLRGPLRDAAHGGWFASVAADGTVDGTKSAYAHAFVVLAASTGTVAGLDGARELLDEALGVLDERFFDPATGLHHDEWDAAWTTLDPYRGVNANMHAVEALLAAADVTGDSRWRDRALGVARYVACEWAPAHDWRIPEHFDTSWTPQLMLNEATPDDPFKPFGATVGHGIEWARLLLHLEAATGEQAPGWLREAAVALYDRAVSDGWRAGPAGHHGFVYTTDWSGEPVVETRMHWVAAEAVGAAAALYRATGERRYADDYARWWDHVATAFVDDRLGSWHHELDADGTPTADVWPGKPDLYHAVQATLVPRLPLAPSMACALRDGLAG